MDPGLSFRDGRGERCLTIMNHQMRTAQKGTGFKMKSLAELQAIRDKARAAVNIRENSEAKTRVLVGMATCGIAAGARPVLTAIVDEVAKRELSDIMVTQTGCIGICQYEPVVEVIDANGEKTTYVKMTAEKALRVVNDHLVNGNVVTEYTIGANQK